VIAHSVDIAQSYRTVKAYRYVSSAMAA
jgi:hypothetical protein